MKIIKTRFRLFRRFSFRFLRSFLYTVFRFWLKRIYNFENLPKNGPCIIVSNHTSYVDWIILSAIYKEKYIVFLGNKYLQQRPIVGWLMRLNILIYVDKENPGYSYFREVVRRIKQGHIIVIYPEGTRSKSGKMISPKIGFIKLALLTRVPIVPVGIRGAYDILPPHKVIPSMQRCEVIVGNKIHINKSNPLFSDILDSEKSLRFISKDVMQEVAFRIMNLIRIMSNQEWDSSVNWSPRPKTLLKSNK